jgi:penicillin-binding protein A
MGAQAWVNFNKQFYIQGTIPFDLPTATSTVLKDNNENLLSNQLAENSFGQGIDNISPFQMSLFNDTVANNGNLMRPMLISKILDNGGNTIQSYTPSSLSTPITSDTATKVRQAMYGVTFCGSGSINNVLLNGTPYSIISKTGTAEIGPGKNADGWLISEAPYTVSNPTQLPALTIVALKENGGEGGSDDGPLTKAIYKDVFTQVDTFKNVQPVAPAANTYCCTAKPQLLQYGC